MNGSFTLPEPLQAEPSKATWTAPVSNDPVTITFRQHPGAADALRAVEREHAIVDDVVGATWCAERFSIVHPSGWRA